MNKYTLHHGDCLEVMRGMADNSVDCIITDPPYFLPAKHYATRKQFGRNFADLGIMEFFFKECFKDIARVLKDEGSFYIFCDGQSYPLFYYHAYFFTKSVKPLIWDKKSAFTGYGWRHQHEIILWGDMPLAKAIPTGDGDILRYPAVKVDSREHPAEKPTELIQRLISKSTKENETVLDMFMGSGSTGVACQLKNRKFIGIEKDATYFEIAKTRIENALNTMPLFVE